MSPKKLKGTLSNSFSEVSITLIPKPDKHTARKLYTNIPDKYWCQNPQQNASKVNLAAHWKDYTTLLSAKLFLVLEYKDSTTYEKKSM